LHPFASSRSGDPLPIGTPEAQRLLAKLAKEAVDANVSQDAQASLKRLGKAEKGVP
jgi:hypothetical protein